MTFDPEARLRDVLRQEAEQVAPAGDGLSRIQRRVAARRARARWLRPALAVGAAAIIAGATAAGLLLGGGGHGKQVISLTTPSHTTAPASPSTAPPTTSAPAPTFPVSAIWPFTSQAEVDAWQQQYAASGAQPWHLDPVQTATNFVDGFLGMTELDNVTASPLSGDTTEVSFGRTLPSESKKVVTVTAVLVQRYGSGPDAPWLVIGAGDSLLKVTAPAAGSTVASPLHVTGPGFGVDEALTAELRTSHGTAPLATAHTGAGSGGPWSADLTFAAPTDSTGALVVWAASALDGAPARVAVVPVHFGTAAAYPSTFVGVKDRRLAVFSSQNGAALRWLTDAQPNADPVDPQVDGSWVYYLWGAGTCADPFTIMRVPYAGGTAEKVLAPGGMVTGYAASGSRLAYVTQSCTNGSQQLVARDLSTGATHTLTAPTPPPAWEGNPAWSGDTLTIVVRTGMLQHIARYAAFGPATSIGQESGQATSCDANHGMPSNPWVSSDGSTLVFACDTGDSTVVMVQRGGTQSTLVTVPGLASTTSLAVAADGQALLLGGLDGNSKPVEFRWSGGSLVQLHPASPTASLAW